MGDFFTHARVLVGYELKQVRRNHLTWAALACLAVLPPLMSMIFGSTIQVSGHPVAGQLKQGYAVAVGLTAVHFLATLYVLCLCQERLGSSYLRQNDALVLSRSISRYAFWLGKLAGIVVPALLYTALGLILLAEEIWRHGGEFSFGILLAELPYALGLTTVASIYLAARNSFGNFLIFFGWLLILPIIYFANLWQLYSGVLREAGPQLGWLQILPQLGGVHAFAMGGAQYTLWRPAAAYSLVSVAVWLAVSLVVGAFAFHRKRL